MAPRRPKNPINDIIDAAGAWLGGNRGSVPSSGAGAVWQASARSAAQSANRRIVKGVEEGVVQFGALGMGTSSQTQRDLMYGVPGAATRAAKEASVSQVTGLAAGAVGAKAAQVAGRAVANTGIPARVANRLTGQEVFLHGSATKNLKVIEPRIPANRTEAKVYGKRPGNLKQFDLAINDTDFYAATRFQEANPAAIKYEGSIYIGKAKGGQSLANAYYTTPNPAKVVKEIPISGNLPYRYFKTPEQTKKAVEKAYKRAGGRLKKK